jgi:putative membrane protein
MREYFGLFLKGIGMGAANVIPGVSGGTIALITGIFEKLIHSIKSFDLKALKLLLGGKFKEFAAHINLNYLIAVFLGIGVSIITIAKLFGFLFVNYPVYIWAYFFGLILASVFFVGRTIDKWSIGVIVMFVVGTVIAILLSVLSPAKENEAIYYLVICGVVAACSMILPGLSGSFVLILLGNYQLVMIDAINNREVGILIPVVIGAGFGLIAFSHFLSWIFKKYKDLTIAVLSGFILGSLGILWPWKSSFDASGQLIPTNKFGAYVDAGGNTITEVKPFAYEQVLPDGFSSVIIWSLILIVGGIVSIWLLEKLAETKGNN